ncbi:type II toxin-antitoxin system RelE/ParE family toxin [Pantoea coffeiphila]|uniref:type II toxin-antitoxin system RelE/ParE family toxin n=1 Tax=Pantoea coffeiphila TaxID=1465635 RepID=UPI001960057F|nr:type II toxin-antitoxin system RelE/ParE family toxin [Pantoea coffeiphila]MBM7344922.1 addiction module RelE/StbE family toxin [Pantoea coffeiphila]
MEITWTRLASQDRQRIREYIAEENLFAAIELDKQIGNKAASLAAHPLKARIGRVEGTRELVIHSHFILIYRLRESQKKIEILRVLHTAQQWP